MRGTFENEERNQKKMSENSEISQIQKKKSKELWKFF